MELIGNQHLWGEVVSVDAVRDEAIEVLGQVATRDDVALARLSFKNWTSLYSANPALPITRRSS